MVFLFLSIGLENMGIFYRRIIVIIDFLEYARENYIFEIVQW